MWFIALNVSTLTVTMNIVSTQGNTPVLKFPKRFFEKISRNNTPSQFEGIEFLPQTLIF